MSGRAPSLSVTFDLDHLAVGAGVENVSSPLQALLGTLPASIQAAFSWIPDFNLTEADALIGIESGAVGSYIVVADPSGTQLATTMVFLTPQAAGTAGAVSLALDLPVDLGSTPLFGPLLAGIRVSGFAVTYSSQAFAAGAVVLPPAAPSPYPAVQAGLSLGFVVTADGSSYPFSLAAGGSSTSLRRPVPRLSALPAGAAPRRALDRTDLAPATQDGSPAISWFTVQKSLGPLAVERIGVVSGAGSVGLAIDASLVTDVVSIELTGFAVTFTPSSLPSVGVSVALDGLALSVATGPLEIAGSLARTQAPAGVEYDGSVLIRAGDYAINAAGSYALVSGAPSLFVYGVAQGEFGGPPAFFVTGLAAGFGVNRALRLPTPNGVATFPMVEAAAQGPGFAPSGVQAAQDALAQLSSGGWVPPATGAYWVAAGVAFNSFALLNGFALLTVEFGNTLTIAVLGVAAMQLPTEVDGGPVFAYAEITLEAVLEPAAGVFSFEALLTSNSYVIDPGCQLTGGVAFDLWFGSNPHAGDFVVTFGGYHPSFAKPDWYPSVPRLGISWQLSNALQIVGQSYFALTPSCVMGGGLLSVTFEAGGLKAWWTAQADFIMYWRPFFFDIDVSISIGISYTATIAFVQATFSVELGISLELWGPPLRGVAHVHWWVISFDVALNGGGSPAPVASTVADWPTFAATSLPAATPQAAPSPSPAAGAPAIGASVCRARPASGLQAIVDAGSAGEIWTFGSDNIAVTTETVIPASAVVIVGPSPTSLSGLPVSVYPLGNVDVVSTHQVCIAAWSGSGWQPGQPLPTGLDVSGWGWTTIPGSLPAALWGQRGSAAGPSLGAGTVAAVVGVAGAGEASLGSGLTVEAGALLVDELPPRALPLAPAPASGGPGPAVTGDSRVQIAATVDTPAATAARAAVVAVANATQLGTNLASGPLPLLAAEVFAVLTAAPMLGPPGTTGPAVAPTAPGAPGAPAVVAHPGRPVLATPGTEPTDPTVVTADASSPALRAVFPSHAAMPTLRAGPRGRASAASSTTTVLDRWAKSAELAMVTPAREPGEPEGARAVSSPAQRRLWPGMTALWSVPEGGLRTLHAEGSTALWIVALDAGQRVVAALRTPSGAATELPPDAATVSMTALSRPDDHQVAGWHAATALRQIASQTLLAEDVVVRAQSPLEVRHRRAPRGRRVVRDAGVFTGRRLVDRTWTSGPGNELRRGWIETWLPAWSEVVVIALARADAQGDRTSDGERGGDGERAAGGDRDGPSPALTVHDRRPGGRPIGINPVATSRQRDGGVVIWRYTLPPAVSATHRRVARVTAPRGWRLDGVVGLERMSTTSTAWPPDRAPAIPPAARAAVATEVWWT